MNKTFIPRSDYTTKKWYIIDASQKPLGRLATSISVILQGKHKIDYDPSVDLGDYLIIINAKNIIIDSWTVGHVKLRVFKPGRPGSSLKKVFEHVPKKIIESAVKNMLPKLVRSTMPKRLKIYDGADHPHKAQNPIFIES
uniref:Large ribosomal subunit protein uL13c n=1 Tax=Coscinodiscus granii TaxID=265552 RepID=A0A8A6KQL4_9STRA|nr:ribosomal protein L13 [Coscinodiscus granii]QTI82939.1 ribosomal protein L13 [Coscinodiscus granii]